MTEKEINPFPEELHWYFISYNYQDPEAGKAGFAWIEMGYPKVIDAASDLQAVIHAIREERHSPKAQVVPISWQFMRIAANGEPEKHLLGDLPPPVD